MKRVLSLFLCAAMLTLSACGNQSTPAPEQSEPPVQGEAASQMGEGAAVIQLGDEEISFTLSDGTTRFEIPTQESVSGVPYGNDTESITVGHDIVYYEDGHDFTYGEGTEADAHSKEEAEAHAVVTIRKPGTYILRGKLSAGQVAVDLGDEAEDDPNAVVTLVLDGVDITCTVAPAVIFYNVYECGDKDNPTKDVDTSAAGANVIISDGTENNINGSYVARIYKPESVQLSEDGTEVVEAKKLHKYDGAFYSKMSMNITCDNGNSGRLFIQAENEGLDSEMHLTINGGTIDIKSGNDGINTNEDGVSVTTINGGDLFIRVTGETGEGDGIDSNGWLVINGGSLFANACENSMDAGIDSDMGIHINGGIVMATGNMLDAIESDGQRYAVFQFAQPHRAEERISLKDAKGGEVLGFDGENDYSVLLYSNPNLLPGNYTLWSGEQQLGHSGTSQSGGRPNIPFMGGMPQGMEPPKGFDPKDMPQFPGGMDFPEMGGRPGDMEPPEGMGFPGGGERPQPADGLEPPEGFAPGGGPGSFGPGGGQTDPKDREGIFIITDGANYFSGVGELAS